jgi:hypothetical protein
MKEYLQRRGSVVRVLVIVLTTFAFISCGDDQAPGPTEGTLQIRALTEGIDFDPDGYLISVNSSQGTRIGHQDTNYVSALEPGQYVVSLADLAENCTLPADDNPQTAQVVAGDTVDVLFAVTCEVLSPPGGGGGGDALRMGR